MQDWADTTVQRLQQQLLVSLEQLHSAEDLHTQHADPSREPDRQAEDTELLRELCADDKAFEAWCLSQIDQPLLNHLMRSLALHSLLQLRGKIGSQTSGALIGLSLNHSTRAGGH